MKEGFVVRTGRTVAIPSGEGNAMCRWCLFSVMFPICAAMMLILTAGNLYKTESHFKEQQVAFKEVENDVVEVSPSASSELRMADKKIVHFSGPYKATAAESDFGLRFDHALKLERATEYCQWQETSSDSCEKCTRRDSNGEEETYDCNCARTFFYSKGWRHHRTISLGFDQPANHHNPQRDPYPSTQFFSRDTVVDQIRVTHPVIQKLRALMRPVTFSANGQAFKPGMLTRFWNWLVTAPEMRFEDIQSLKGLYTSPAFEQDHFVFTNTWQGWFFSAYEMPVWQKVVRGFGQYLEGSLLDWQIGDLYDMFNGCTPGDLRSRFFLADPEEVSVIGELAQSEAEGSAFKVWPHKTSNNFEVAIIHEGSRDAQQLFARETEIAHLQAWWARGLNLLGGPAVVYLLHKFGLWTARKRRAMFGVSFGISLTLMAAVWAAAYGLAGDSAIFWTVLAGLGGIALLCVSLAYDTRAKKTADHSGKAD